MRCWYTRWQLSNALDRGELPARQGRGHAARCPSCQAFARSLVALDVRLSCEADAAVAPVTPERPRWPWLVGGPLAVATAAVIALALGLYERSPPPPPAPLAMQAPEPIAVRSLAAQVVRAFTSSPLETELDNLIHDGQRGIDVILATGGLRDTP
jgi:hypothetical protein